MELHGIDVIDKTVNTMCQCIVVGLSLGIGMLLLERVRTVYPF